VANQLVSNVRSSEQNLHHTGSGKSHGPPRRRGMHSLSTGMCKELTLGSNRGQSSNLWTSTSPNSHTHRPRSCLFFTSCPETQFAVGRHSGALLCGVQRGEWALHMVHLCGRTTEVPSTSWALHIHAEGWGEDIKSSPPLNTMKSLR